MKSTLKVASAATALALTTACPAWAGSVLYVGGTGTTGLPSQASMAWLPDNGYVGKDDTLVGVKYPGALMGMDRSIAAGATSLRDTCDATEGPKTLVGVSQGSIVVHEEERRIMALPEDQRPAQDQLVFVHIADPARPGGGFTNRLPRHVQVPVIGLSRPEPVVETPYQTVYVTREYDGWADFPDRPLNVLATGNALMGTTYIHPYYDVDLSTVPDSNITNTKNGLGGRTTSYLVPTKQLPLTQPLRQLGVDDRVVDEIDRHLRPIIDAGYKRNDPKPKVRESLKAVPGRTGMDTEKGGDDNTTGHEDSDDANRTTTTGSNAAPQSVSAGATASGPDDTDAGDDADADAAA
jgi:diacyltrehalose acyltransferase